MGFYMNGFGEGTTRKAQHLIDNLGAEKLLPPCFTEPSTGKLTLCVVENELFDAVAVAFCEEEFKVFAEGLNGRLCTWLTLDIETIEKYTSGLQRYLAEDAKG